MASEQAESLRKAIENLINVKLRDLVRPGGVDRLVVSDHVVFSEHLEIIEKGLNQKIFTHEGKFHTIPPTAIAVRRRR